ncbi:hypothetical protein EON64_20915, partial [archaeon]
MKDKIPSIALSASSGQHNLMSQHTVALKSTSKLQKAWLLGILNLFQTAPKGYLSYLPILLREQRASLKQLATLSLCTAPELLKPVFAWAFDLPLLANHKAVAVLTLQACTIFLFAYFSSLSSPSFFSLLLLFSLSHLLTALHDAAADGLAVSLLLPSEQAAG